MTLRIGLVSIGLFAFVSAVHAQKSGELAKDLANPVSSLISVPFQYNYDTGFGPQDGDRHLLNIQPVIPTDISESWNLVTRAIVPVISQDDIPAGAGRTSGLGDVVATFFFSPKKATSGGLIWGVGPVVLAPTATDDILDGENTESTYDWENDAWSVLINAGVNQIVEVGNQLMQFGGGLRYWAETPEGALTGAASQRCVPVPTLTA